MIAQKSIFHKEAKKRLMDMEMTQVQLANRLGIKPAYLNDILQGRRDGGDYVTKIFAILEMDGCQADSKSY